MVRLSVGVAALTLLALGACKGGETAGDSGPVTLEPSAVHTLGSSEVIGQARDLEVLPDGSVWLLNSVVPFFVGFDAEGNIVGLHGTAGGGPEEFRAPAGLLTGGHEGEAWAFDFARHTFIRISEPDRPWSQIDVPEAEIPEGSVRGGMNLIGSTVRTARLGDEFVVPWTTGTPGATATGYTAYRLALLQADLSALDPATGSVRTVVSLGEVLEDPSVGFVATDGGFPLWYRLWAVCGDHLRVHDRVRNQLRGFTGAGREIEPIDLPPVPFTEVTPLDFSRATFTLRQAEIMGAVGERLAPEDSVRVLNEVAQSLTGEPHELAAYLPRYVDFRCSTDGAMWLQPIDLRRGGLEGGTRWLRILPDGVTRDVHLPYRFDAMRFTPDRIWGIQRDELDVASVAWLDLPTGL